MIFVHYVDDVVEFVFIHVILFTIEKLFNLLNFVLQSFDEIFNTIIDDVINFLFKFVFHFH